MTLIDTKNKLDDCHEDIKKLVTALSEIMDIIVICGHRTKEEQNDAFKRGASKLKWPKSGHNSWPSKAVDVAPYKDGKLDWNDKVAFEEMQAKVRELAKNLGIGLKPVITWDMVHTELK